ncbi:MAG: YheC/YheD family protein [Chloroflexota bacterium]
MDSYDVEVCREDRPRLGDRLRQPTGRSGDVEISFGRLTIPVRSTSRPGAPTALLTLDAVRHGIAFPSGIVLHAQPTEAGTVRIGPLIGILTAGHLTRGRLDRRSPFTYQSYLFENLARAARRMHGLVFAFEPVGLDWVAGRIDGWTWVGGSWREVRMPFPDAVYNRVPNRRLEAQERVQATLATLARSGVPVFNPHFIDKEELYESLLADPEVSHFLPPTKPLRHYSQVTDSLAESPIVYLKPRFGSLGNGIVRLERVSANLIRVRYRSNNKNHSRLLPQREMREFVSSLTEGKDYVCQRGIELPLYRGRPFDFRILTQKDGAGVWRLTGMGVRVAGAGAITTHVPSGGSIARVDRVLSSVFGRDADRVAGNLRAAIATIAPAIERDLNETFGELSMDLGVDRLGNVWFFEANSKPHKFDEDAIRLPSWDRTIQYAAYLGGFPGLSG